MIKPNIRRVVTRQEWIEERNGLKAATLAHYDRLEACRTREEFEAEGWSAKTCPLCQAHKAPHYGAIRCYTGCPVYLATRREWCSGTPWMEMNTTLRSLGGAELDGPLPEVLAMRAYLDGLDWHRHPRAPVEVTLKGVLVTVKGPDVTSRLKAEALAYCDRLLECRTWGDFIKPLTGDGVPGLCDNYYQGGSCAGCPVSAATGRAKCGNSPWWAMLAAIERLYPVAVIGEPLPEVLDMRAFIDGLDWSGQP